MTTADRNPTPPRATRVEREREDDALNRDPISGAPGSHPVGTGVGAASGGAAGAGLGALAGGPIGAAIGAVAGAVVGGLAGKAAAEELDPTAEEAYWSKTFRSRPYVAPNAPYDDYRPAYQFGWESWNKRRGDPVRTSFQDVEADLRAEWEGMKVNTKLGWDRAKDAVQDAWSRVSDRDDARRAREASDRASQSRRT